MRFIELVISDFPTDTPTNGSCQNKKWIKMSRNRGQRYLFVKSMMSDLSTDNFQYWSKGNQKAGVEVLQSKSDVCHIDDQQFVNWQYSTGGFWEWIWCSSIQWYEICWLKISVTQSEEEDSDSDEESLSDTVKRSKAKMIRTHVLSQSFVKRAEQSQGPGGKADPSFLFFLFFSLCPLTDTYCYAQEVHNKLTAGGPRVYTCVQKGLLIKTTKKLFEAKEQVTEIEHDKRKKDENQKLQKEISNTCLG